MAVTYKDMKKIFSRKVMTEFKNLNNGDKFECYGDVFINYEYPKICTCIKLGHNTAQELDESFSDGLGIVFLLDPEDWVDILVEIVDLKVGDMLVSETLHGAYSEHKVVRVTKSQAILDNGERLPINGDRCHHIKNMFNKHMIHYYTYYRLPNKEVEERAKKRGYEFKYIQ